MFKIVLLGDGQSGKSTIFANPTGPFLYVENSRMILGAQFYEMAYDHNGLRAKISLWDIEPHPRYFSLYPQYIRGAKAVLVVFASNKKATFLNAQSWIQMSRSKQIEQPYGFLVGVRSEEQKRQVEKGQGQELAQKWGFIYRQLALWDKQEVKDLLEMVVICTYLLNQLLQIGFYSDKY